MRGLAIALCILGLTGVAMADPEISYGTPGAPYHMEQRDDVCQWGFEDESVGWGYSLYNQQQLGIECFGPMTVTGAGFYCEFASAGNLDVVIFDNGVEVSRTTVFAAAGINEYDIDDVCCYGTVCMMLCPINFDGVCGEDFDSPPWHSFYSNGCAPCANLMSDNNQFMWLYYDGVSPTDSQTWGSIKTLFW